MSQWLEGPPRQGEAVRRTVIKAVLISLLFIVLLGLVLFSNRRPVPAPIVIGAITPLPTQTRAPTATPGPIQVYVSGAVARPGVYVLAWDSRVEQALAAAGGTTTDADLVRVNMAQRVYDEQQIYVPARDETVTPIQATPPVKTDAKTLPLLGQKININTASVSELETLPGIGPALGQRIVDYRQVNGPFSRIEDIKKVKGIGDSIFAQIKELITVE